MSVTDDRQGPQGPVLEGVQLKTLAPPLVDTAQEEEAASQPQVDTIRVEVPGMAVVSPGDAKLDGICLKDLGPAEIDRGVVGSLSVLFALQLTPEEPESQDIRGATAFEQVRTFLSLRKPRATVIGCGAGGALVAAEDILNVTCIIDPDWRTLECIRANGGAQGVNLVRLPLTLKDCRDPLAAARPEVLLGNACHKTDTLDLGEVAARHAEAITHLFTHSCAQVLILEAPVGFAGTDKWVNNLLPFLLEAGCVAETATLSATAVGVPTGKRRVFAVAVKRRSDPHLAAKLERWKRQIERPPGKKPTVGDFLGQRGTFFLKRGKGEKEIFSFQEHTVTITQAHIMGRKPPAASYTAHPRDAGPLQDAHELSWEQFARLTTTDYDFNVPPTVRRCDAARVLEEFSLPPMLREVLNLFRLQAVTLGAAEGEATAKGDQEGELSIGLACLQIDDDSGTTAPATAKFQAGLPRFKVTPTEVVAALSRSELRQKLVKEVTPAVTRRATRQVRLKEASTEAAPAAEDEPSPRAEEPVREPSPVTVDMDPPLEAADEDVVEDTAADGENSPAADGDQAAHCRGHSEVLEQMERTLRSTESLVEAQRQDVVLGPIHDRL